MPFSASLQKKVLLAYTGDPSTKQGYCVVIVQHSIEKYGFVSGQR